MDNNEMKNNLDFGSSNSSNIKPSVTNIEKPMSNNDLNDSLKEKKSVLENVSSSVNNRSDSKKNIEDKKSEYMEIKMSNASVNLKDVSYFDAKVLDLMGWNALRILLSIMTFGIGAPWGECLYLKYKMNHTIINGKRLKFIGDGSELFVEQFKWTFLTIVTFGIYSLWIPVKKTSWVVSNIFFEDEEIVKGESFFGGSVLKYVGINILCFIITIISFGLLYPLAECIKLKWLSRNTIISRKLVSFDGKALNLFGKYISWIFLTIITLGIYGLWLVLKKTNWEVSHTHLISTSGYKKEKNNKKAIIIVGVILAIIVIILLATLIIPSIGSGSGLNFDFNQSSTLNEAVQPAIQVGR